MVYTTHLREGLARAVGAAVVETVRARNQGLHGGEEQTVRVLGGRGDYGSRISIDCWVTVSIKEGLR